MQEQQSKANEIAWSYRAYEHWMRYSGRPDQAAAQMKDDPASFIKHELPYLGDVTGKRVINLMGSNGRKAVPLSLLGADVTVVDISPEGARYAEELAEAAGVHIEYIISDVMALPLHEFASSFDIVYMEGGIFHYIADLSGFAQIANTVLSPGGRLVASDFHPIRKCISINGDRISLAGDYFDEQFHESSVAFQQFFADKEQDSFPKCLLRYWTMGEIVTAFAHAGLIIKELVELPFSQLADIPGQFILAACKPADR
ncbi:class I SAM-dependent methyltransferase [bacterium]|nr:class I SAM-dependent methyltransferase [bacterium]